MMNNEELITKITKTRFETLRLKSDLCYYRQSYILLKGTITVVKETANI